MMRLIKVSILLSMILAILFVMFILLYYFTFQLWIQGGQLIIKPNTDILATAEYLYANPQPKPNQFSILGTEMEEGYICVSIGPGLGNYWFTRWFLNGERVPYNMHHQSIYNESYSNIYCLEIYKLPLGLHLVEIQANNSPFYTALSYQWAIKIEPSPTPSPTPPTP